MILETQKFFVINCLLTSDECDFKSKPPIPIKMGNFQLPLPSL